MTEAPVREKVAKAVAAMQQTQKASQELCAEILAGLTPEDRAAWERRRPRKRPARSTLDQ